MSLSTSSIQLAVVVASLAGVGAVLLGELSNVAAAVVFGAAFAATMAVQIQLGVSAKPESTFAKYDVDEDFEDEVEPGPTKSKKKKTKKKKNKGPTQSKKKKQPTQARKKEKKKEKQAAVAPPVQEVSELEKLEAMDESTMSKGQKKRHKAKLEKAREEAEAESEEEVTNGWTKIPLSKKTLAKAEKDNEALTGEAATKPTTKTIRVPQKKHGAIFGAKAVNLHALQSKTQTTIQMPKRETNSDAITISGPAEGVRKCEIYIQNLITKGFCEATHPGQTQATVEVPPEKLHFIIGVKGAVISVLQERTDTKINTPDRKTKSHKVTIIGGKTGVRKAKAAIKQLITQGFSPLTHDGWIKEEVDVPENMLRKLIGQGGKTIKALQTKSGAKILIPEVTSDNKMVIVAGVPVDVAAACEAITKLLDAEGATKQSSAHPDWAAYDENHDHHDEDALWD